MHASAVGRRVYIIARRAWTSWAARLESATTPTANSHHTPPLTTQFVGGHMAASRYFPVIAVLSSLDVPARSVLERLRRERGRNVCRRAINDARYAKNRGRKRPRGKLAVACLAHLCGAGQLPRAALLHDTGCVRSHHLSVRSPFTTPAAAGTLVLGYGPRHKN